MVGAVSPDVVQGVLERLLAPPSISCRARGRLAWGEDSKRRRRLKLEILYPDFAAGLAYQRRIQLALAVAILCDGVEGPGAARLARWRNIDLESRRWTVYLAHGTPGRKSRRGRMASVAVELPPRAVKVFEEARELRDGMCLLLDLVRPVHCSLAEARRTFGWPRRPAPPGPRALVFPGRTPREPISEHAFRHLLQTMGVTERPGALCKAGALLSAP